MIKIFNGRVRGIGESKKQETFLQLQVRFRRYLHHFGPFGWTIFTAIALHMDEDGWSWPGKDLLSSETGLAVKTIGKWIKFLDKLEIKGERVLLHFQPKERKGRGQFDTNRYLLFPTKTEIEAYERGELRPPYTLRGHTARRDAARRRAELRPSARREAARGRRHHVHEEKPLFKEIQGEEEVGTSGAGAGRDSELSDNSSSSEEEARRSAPDDDDEKIVLEFYQLLTGNEPEEADKLTYRGAAGISRAMWLTAISTAVLKLKEPKWLSYCLAIISQIESDWRKPSARGLARNDDDYLAFLLDKLVRIGRLDREAARRFHPDGGKYGTSAAEEN